MEELTKQNKQLQHDAVTKTLALVASNAKGRAGRTIERFRNQMQAAGINMDQFGEALNGDIDSAVQQPFSQGQQQGEQQ